MSRTPAAPGALEALLGNPRFLYLAGPMAAALLAWAWLVPAAVDMYGEMNGLSAWMMSTHWDLRFGALIFLMWTVMMAAMMLPSLAPALLLYGTVCRGNAAGGSPVLRVNAFATGYVGAWAAFSALATLLQWQLAQHGLITMMMEMSDARLGYGVMILAGAYQWTPLKRSCLVRCRSPAEYISTHWRKGVGGAGALGFGYGVYCLGCCWALMLLLFVSGVMNLAYIVLLTLLVLVEKSTPWGLALARVCGVGLVAAGLVGLATA